MKKSDIAAMLGICYSSFVLWQRDGTIPECNENMSEEEIQRYVLDCSTPIAERKASVEKRRKDNVMKAQKRYEESK